MFNMSKKKIMSELSRRFGKRSFKYKNFYINVRSEHYTLDGIYEDDLFDYCCTCTDKKGALIYMEYGDTLLEAFTKVVDHLNKK